MNTFINDIYQTIIGNYYNKKLNISVSIDQEEIKINIGDYDDSELDLHEDISKLLLDSMPGHILGEDLVEGLDKYHSVLKLYDEFYIFRGVCSENEIKINLLSKLTNDELFYEKLFELKSEIHKETIEFLKIRSPKDIFLDFFTKNSFEYHDNRRLDELTDGDIITFRKKTENGFQELEVIYPNYNGWDIEHTYTSVELEDEVDYWIDFLKSIKTNFNNYIGIKKLK